MPIASIRSATDGLTAEQAHAQKIDVVTSRVELADAIARPWTYQENPSGALGLLADASVRC